MSDKPERAFIAMQFPTGAGMSTAVGVSAPIGAVSPKTRARAARTALAQEGPTTFVLHTELRGTVSVQSLADDGDWRTISEHRTTRVGRTHLELPPADGAPRTFRVVFAPKNPNLTSWISSDIHG